MGSVFYMPKMGTPKIRATIKSMVTGLEGRWCGWLFLNSSQHYLLVPKIAKMALCIMAVPLF